MLGSRKLGIKKSPIMKTPIIAIAVMLILSGVAHAKPSIIFIMTDDQGYGDLGCYGHPSIKTSNIDRMAEEGVPVRCRRLSVRPLGNRQVVH